MGKNSVLLRLSLTKELVLMGWQLHLFVNGELDYKNVAVIAAGTDPGSTAEIDKSETTFSYYSVI